MRFGTGGWRAIIADEFTKQNVRLVAQALAERMHAEGVAGEGIAMTYDRRFLADRAARWIVEVLVANDIPVTLIDRPAPTPVAMWTVRNQNLPYGIAVTASHNPAEYNGIKIFTRGGRDADVAVTDALAERINAMDPSEVRSLEEHEAAASPLLTEQTSINWYLDAILEQLDTEVIRHAHLNVVLDPMFGVGQTAMQTVLLTARCNVSVINARHDPLFGGRMPSPASGSLEPLRRAVLDAGADIGIATDGDADRLGIIDNEGTYLTPNQVLVLVYDYLLTRKGWSGPAVRNMSTTHMLDRVAEAHGQTCHEVPVGFKWISAKMEETGAIIGGESSGGLTVRGHIPGKDGIHSGSLLVEALAASGTSLADLYRDIIARYGELHMVEAAYAYTPSRREELSTRIFTEHDLPPFEPEIDRIGWEDGCKVYFTGGGWVTIRFSGTEPVIRVFAEMEKESDAEAIARSVADYYGLGQE